MCDYISYILPTKSNHLQKPIPRESHVLRYPRLRDGEAAVFIPTLGDNRIAWTRGLPVPIRTCGIQKTVPISICLR